MLDGLAWTAAFGAADEELLADVAGRRVPDDKELELGLRRGASVELTLVVLVEHELAESLGNHLDRVVVRIDLPIGVEGVST
ncbi:MAG: hypothetical protein ACR2HQ_07560 [Ilumatobacteraceae bacterium]